MTTKPAYFDEEIRADDIEIQEQSTTDLELQEHVGADTAAAAAAEADEDKKAKRWVLIRATAAEMLVTFLFIFIVTATGVNMHRNGVDNPTVDALVTAFSAIALIYSFADVSGAHFNPSVTFATFVTGKMSLVKAALYMAAQLGGATCASLFILATFPDAHLIYQAAVVVKPKTGDISLGYSFIMEMFLTFVLVYVIFATAFDTVDSQNVEIVKQLEGRQRRVRTRNMTIYTISGTSKAGFAPISIGFTLGFLSFVGSSVSGGAYNPARAFGPDLVTGDFHDQWLYWAAGFSGATLAGYVQMFFASRDSSVVEVVKSIGRGIRDSNLPDFIAKRLKK